MAGIFMSKKSRFLFWWIEPKIVFFLIFGTATYLFFIPSVFEIRFYFSASQVSGKVQDYGVTAEGIGATSINGGSWTKTIYSPWINVERPANQDDIPRTCRIEGQLGVFGNWISDNELVLKRALEHVVKEGYIEYFILQEHQMLGAQSFGTMCRVNKAVDAQAICIFLILLSIDFSLLVWAYRSFSYRKYIENIKRIQKS
jgi:hypothetical protein